MKNNDISILGSGLIGSLLSIYLRKRGLDVHMYEKRADNRKSAYKEEGRSINMALSDRGWKALEDLGLTEKVKPLTIPMYGRKIHDEHGKTTFIPYGKEGQAIYSISRGKFNQLLIDEAEAAGVNLHFEHKIEDVSLKDNTLLVSNPEASHQKIHSEVIIGSDGAYSALRNAMLKQVRFDYKQEYISHGYKELTIPATESGEFAMDPNALHIWPRGSFMLIALPNPDKSFTCTLFLPFEGKRVCFENIRDEKDVEGVFKTYFDDAFELMPNLSKEYFTNPTAALINIECFPWMQGKSLLIGDASHAMVPFYGQGMNCGFEDCYILDKLINKFGTNAWELVFAKFQKVRKPDTDAICQLAMENFEEMKNAVSDPKFQIRKKIEAKLHNLYPLDWIPLYTMVTFSDMPYSEAYAQGKLQESIMDRVMADPLITQNWDKLDYEDIIDQMDKAKAV
ncbi:Kynurenine 3-monooxygenase [Indibacter alkaliphilus LW1]|jgi:kynurenine 3-monooxygenase|uniref:Kynurenine 3-monooxygenase n=1 Tax=Indibacter alkaliphilus (strain CCUG 57479 / KCTC 22604 / LW1) TaxID=1189612 RepID=S2DJ66_INDAL|nr:NAD(P)/FAD-dependent oxidoreductase [Indibacter alkaliphilus]EOZ91996.1 Kynurenine 3-monooxygenase [Indibacter alkaliphilus LW1]